MQQLISVTRLQAHSCQKIRADHLQAVASRLVAPKHQTRFFKRLFDYWKLALVRLEIEDLPRLGVLASQVAINLALEFLPGHRIGFVHPGCTIEALSIPPRYFGKFPRFGPSDH